MDPRQCLIDAADAITDGDLMGAAELVAAYRRWRSGGGFEPPAAVNWGPGWEPGAPITGDDLADRIEQQVGEEVAEFADYHGRDGDYPD
jgi:hypothetical protein